jgi:transcriptional regulator of heat shock response
LEFKGKAVPELMKIRKYFARKKQEREILHQLPDEFKKFKNILCDFETHYSKDNITMRDRWMATVNSKLKENDKYMKELDKKLDKNNEDTLSLLIDSKRNTIIDFASRVIDENAPVTREQFNRVFKLYDEYESIIESNKLTNGEVDIAYRIIKESYEKHMKAHSFIEDVRGY